MLSKDTIVKRRQGILFVVSRLDVKRLAFTLISLASGTMLGSARSPEFASAS